MGMEVVWIRLYTPFIGVMVYSFALILVTYLGATFLGSFAYRSFTRNPESKTWVSLAALSLLAVLPLFACQPGHMNFLVRVLLGIAPFSAARWLYHPAIGRPLVRREMLIGQLTPMLSMSWGAFWGRLSPDSSCFPGLASAGACFYLRLPWILFGSSNFVRHYSSAAIWRKRIAAICFLATHSCGDTEAQEFRKPLPATRPDER